MSQRHAICDGQGCGGPGAARCTEAGGHGRCAGCLQQEVLGDRDPVRRAGSGMLESMSQAMPEVVTLCGATRFREAFESEQRRLTLEGCIVISVGMFELNEGSHVEVDLGELHKRKIDLSQRIHVINEGGYIGSSTRSEIQYAHERGIKVTYLEP